jgi:hypothetical protein
MKTNAIRNPRTLARGIEATFGPVRTPQAGRKSLLALGAVCLLITGAASADWRVYDQRVHEQLRDEITPRIGDTSASGSGTGSVTGNQKIIYEQYTLGSYESSGEAVENPQWPAGSSGGGGGGSTSGFSLSNFSDMTSGAGGTGGGAIQLESNIARCASARDAQKKVCEEIVKTENAQFIYMVRFHEMTVKRKERLDKIEQERQALEEKPENYGKLQDNTNKLLALATRMDLDRAQMESAMNAYDARLTYLKAFQAQKTRETMSGKTNDAGGDLFGIDLGSLGSAIVGGVALKGALETQKSDEPEGYKRMEWL